MHQDSLGKAATIFTPPGAPHPAPGQLYPYWVGQLSDGVALGLVAASGDAKLSVDFANVPNLGSGTWYWTEMYSGRTGSGKGVSVELGPHDMAVYKVTRTGGGIDSGIASPTVSQQATPTPSRLSSGGSVTLNRGLLGPLRYAARFWRV